MGRADALLSRYRVPSDPLRTERRVELVAVLLSAVLVLQLLYSAVVLSVKSLPEPILPSPDTLNVSELARSGLVTAQQSDELRARPVFWPSRRPVESGQELASGEKPKRDSAGKNKLDKVKLLGVVGSGDSAVIIVLVQGKKKRILLGDKVVGWTLSSVGSGDVVFSADGKLQKVELEHAQSTTEDTTEGATPASKQKSKLNKKH